MIPGGKADEADFRILESMPVRSVVTSPAHGGRLPARDAARFAGAPAVRERVPQRALLRHAALAVTNGGLNTVLDALEAGVPLVVVPIAFEQGAIGARLEYAGAGKAVPYREATPRRIGEAIDAVLGEPRFAERAGVVARAIRASGGVSQAVAVVEAVARTRRPVRRDEAVPTCGEGSAAP